VANQESLVQGGPDTSSIRAAVLKSFKHRIEIAAIGHLSSEQGETAHD
jgi:hypothetical protein